MTRRQHLSSEELLAEQQKAITRREARIQQVAAARQRDLMVVMEDVYNPHNLAAIARSCDAFGVQHITFSVENESLFDPQEIGKVSSSSASKWLNYRVFTEGTRHCLTTLKQEGWHIIATSAEDGATVLWDMDFTRQDKFAVLVGNERDGISPVALAMADTCMTIPMIGMIRSFNVSVATAIILAEITRQRRASSASFTISDEEAKQLAQDFMQR